MTGKHLKHATLADEFVKLMHAKSLGNVIDAELKTVKQIQEMAAYFRLMFSMIEQQHMRKLPCLSVEKQSELIDHRDDHEYGPRARYHL
jgi:hypothetical protein